MSSQSPPPPPPSESLDDSIGVILIGLALTGSLLGVSTSQAMWYYKHYHHDRKLLKVVVGIVWSLDVFHLLLYIATLWVYIVQKKLAAFGDTSLPWTSNVQIFSNACTVFTIQSFYIFRIITLSKSLPLAGALATFVLADLGLATTLFAKSILIRTAADLVQLQAFDITLNAITATTDVLLSGTLLALLMRKRTGSQGGNHVINGLLFYTVNTGLLTSICAILSLVMVLISPASAIYVVFYYIGSHLYSVSLLAMLNARADLRAQADSLGHNSALSRVAELMKKLSPGARGGASARDSLDRAASQIRSSAMMPPIPAGIVVAIQRDTTVTFDERGGHLKALDLGGAPLYGAGATPRTSTGGTNPSLERVESSVEAVPVRTVWAA